MGREIGFIKAVPEFKKEFALFCIQHNLDKNQAIRILSRTIETIAHEDRADGISEEDI